LTSAAADGRVRATTPLVVHHIPVCPFSQRLKILLHLKGIPDAVAFDVVDITRPRDPRLLALARGASELPIMETMPRRQWRPSAGAQPVELRLRSALDRSPLAAARKVRPPRTRSSAWSEPGFTDGVHSLYNFSGIRWRAA
jgi:hypothetical protein